MSYTICVQVSVLVHLDDPLDAIAVHAWNGTWGLIAPGFFSAEALIQVSPNPLSFCCPCTSTTPLSFLHVQNML